MRAVWPYWNPHPNLTEASEKLWNSSIKFSSCIHHDDLILIFQEQSQTISMPNYIIFYRIWTVSTLNIHDMTMSMLCDAVFSWGSIIYKWWLWPQHQGIPGEHRGFMSGGKGFADFANPAGWSPGACRGALLPEDDSKLPVLFRSDDEDGGVP